MIFLMLATITFIYKFKFLFVSSFLRSNDFFKKIDQKKYIIWVDTGSHFRCGEFLHYLFNELALENIQVLLVQMLGL